MSLRSGQPLLHYRLGEMIGEGGMGQVWRARDTTLDRDVAIKVLPESFIHDAARLARFEREARLLASLRHPHIATIHGLHQAEGRHFLVMELAEGEDLAARLERGPLPRDEALAMARQLAEALEAAHEQGVVHRDLKPANIQIAPDGQIKVLDFGLAKAMCPEESVASGSPSLSPTLTLEGTVAGVILGTAGYMSPEQAKGKAVDRRADIWAFGVTLWESLSGRPLFRRETVSETLAAVLMAEPDLSLLPKATPGPVRRLLERCLERDPRRRLRDIGEARVLLEDLEAGRLPTAAGPERESRRQPVWLWALAGLAAGAMAMAVGTSLLGRDGSESRTSGIPARVNLPLAPSSGLDVGSSFGTPSLAISPDGRSVAFRGRVGSGSDEVTSLLVRRLSDSAAISFTGTEWAYSPFFSPDGQWIGFVSRGASLRRVPAGGGIVDTVFERDGWWITTACWSRELGIVFAGRRRDEDQTRRSGLYGITPGTGEVTTLLEQDADGEEPSPNWPFVVPGGRGVLYTAVHSREPSRSRVMVLDLESGESTVLAEGQVARLTAAGDLLFAREGRLLTAPFETAELSLAGTPQVVLEGLASDTIYGHSVYDISGTGTLAYLSRDSIRPDVDSVLWVNEQGQAESMGAPSDIYMDPRLSPDGSRLAFSNPTGENDIWVRDLVRGTQTRLTFAAGEDETPVWSPDGRWLAYSSENDGESRTIRRRRPDGSGSEEVIWTGDAHTHVWDWTPDGAALLVDARGESGPDIWAVEVAGGEVTPLLANPYPEFHARLSPDGRWLSYTAVEADEPQVFVQPYPALDRKVQVSVDSGSQAVWSRDGRRLFFRGRSGLMVADFDLASRDLFSSPRLLVEGEYGSGKAFNHFSYDVAPDGRFVMTVADSARFPSHVSLILNWPPAHRETAARRER